MSDIGDVQDVADVRIVQPSGNTALYVALALILGGVLYFRARR